MSNDVPAPYGPPPTDAGSPVEPQTAAPLPPGLKPLEKGDPARVGPYRLVGRIGAGGMGAVYGALDDRGRCVAVKTVHVRFARRSRYRDAFAREVRMLARARGVSTARLHAADVTAKVPWLAFDYVPGRDLRAHVRAFGPLSGDMLRAFAAGTAEGLAALHAAGIAHRDIKPGNVILAPEGPKIVDFGIATEIGADRATDRAASYGTPGWVAPERFTGATAAPEADVFAWGALVALAATGRDPYGTGAPDELRRRAEQGAYDVEGVPDALRALVERALSADPAARPRAVELMRALLPPPEEVGETGRVPAERTLAAMLRAYWRGVDDAGHDPARWAVALGVLSAAGVAGGLAAGTGATTGTGTAAGTGAGAAGAAGAPGVAGGAAAAGAQTATGSSAAGGALSALAGSKLAAAGVGLVLLGGVAAGGYVAYDRLLGPRAAVTEAAGILEEGQGFTVSLRRSYTTAYAEEVAAQTGEPVEAVIADSAVEEEYLYSADDRTFLVRGAAMGEGTVAAANRDGGLYVYGPAPEAAYRSGLVQREFPEGTTAEALSPSLVTGPVRGMLDSGELERVGGSGSEGGGENTVYSGPVTGELIVDGEVLRERTVGLLELDSAGRPAELSYDVGAWAVRIAFTEVDEAADVVEPQRVPGAGGEDVVAVHAPVCGRRDISEKTWEVRADGWDMSCERALEVTDLAYFAEEDEDRVEFLLGYSGSGTTSFLVDEEIYCMAVRDYDMNEAYFEFGTNPWFLHPCRGATPQGQGELGYLEVDIEDTVLIGYVLVE
ncbi:serine/threonine-protein kinase [Nocardiopsis aegyptia]|uniref:Putative Ser/Thr protein kinase n=1 Tax=Nocardiopsis aegyptia TaxID=220378 RepID=A0A7Z0ETD7_9ACTN|nr:serine/threonine-protein kinase [Nocardiopsis aegyptia]NYJ37955.1 putative Ser/Thr protein kinase [Nocardiopsis aegyptia]